jgi:hypothetical protein
MNVRHGGYRSGRDTAPGDASFCLGHSASLIRRHWR